MKEPPRLFGSADDQRLLLDLVQNGSLRMAATRKISVALLRSGIIAKIRVRRKPILILDGRHPAYEGIRAVLADMAAIPAPAMILSPDPRSEYRLDVDRPLAQRSRNAFRMLYFLTMSTEAVSAETLAYRIPHVSRAQIAAALSELVDNGIVERNKGRLTITSSVPKSYRELVLHLGSILQERDRALRTDLPLMCRARSFGRAEDNAPVLFGSDIRFRNLTALAKYGPMYIEDLRHITGTTAKAEDAGHAPFGRGALVRCWETASGSAAELDPSYPLKIPLRALLLKLEEIYPLPPCPQYREVPACPQPRAWRGDKFAMFGGAVSTSILMAIGSLGWSFEALCVSACIGYDRVVVGKAIKNLENFGILEASRKRRPGFDVRVLRIARLFAARDELRRLLEMAVDIWPEFAARTAIAMKQLSPRTKAHLRKCGLPLQPPLRNPNKKWRRLSDSERRLNCVRQYCALTTTHKRDLASYEVNRIDSGLYRYIKRLWGSFAAFRLELRLEPKMSGITQRPNAKLRERCVTEYFRLTTHAGYQPNSRHLSQLDPSLWQRIRTQWGGFPQFCEDLKILPARRKRSATSDPGEKRRGAIAEYCALERKIGRAPSVPDLRLHTSGLYKRIARLWGGLRALREELGAANKSTQKDG